MSKIEDFCQNILRDNGHEVEFTRTKKASLQLPKELPTMMRKVASEIREVARPVEVTTEDLNYFIGRLYND